MGKDGAPIFIATPTHAAPQEPLFGQLQDELDALFGTDPPVFIPRLLSLRDGVAEVDEGKCTHQQLHTFLRATLQLHPLILSDKAAEGMTCKSMRSFMVTAADALMISPDRKDSLSNWRDPTGSGRREPMHVRYSSERLKTSN